MRYIVLPRHREVVCARKANVLRQEESNCPFIQLIVWSVRFLFSVFLVAVYHIRNVGSVYKRRSFRAETFADP